MRKNHEDGVLRESFDFDQLICGLEAVDDASKTIFVASEIDMEKAMLAVKKGIWTFGSEWFMNFIMRQELDFQAPQFAESL